MASICWSSCDSVVKVLMIVNQCSSVSYDWSLVSGRLTQSDTGVKIDVVLCCCVADRGTQASRLVQCFSSHPSVMKVEPQDAFMLPANSLQELQVGIRPMSASPCSQLMYINVVDVELHQVRFSRLLVVFLLLHCSFNFSDLIYCCAFWCIHCLL